MKNFKSLLTFILCLALLFCGISCKKEQQNAALSPAPSAPVAREPEKAETRTLKVISMSPEITETICALGKTDFLIARTDYCDYPAEIGSLPSIGDMYYPNIEQIASLQADIVFASSIISNENRESLKNAGVNLVEIKYADTIEGTYDAINFIASYIGAEEEAEILNKSIQDRIKAVADKTAAAEKKTGYYILGYGDWGDFTATGDTFVNGIMDAAGLINSAGEYTQWMISREVLIQKNPQILILPTYSYSAPESDIEYIRSNEPYSALTGEFVLVEGNLFDRQGPRIADAVEQLAKAVYPELFK